MSYEPKIYVACLADYNAGRLHGAWIDADQDPDDIEREVWAMLRESKDPNVMRRDWECRCGHKWAATVHYAESTPNLSGEATQWCPECGEKPLCGSPAYPSAEEWAIHDYDMGGLRIEEYTGFTEVSRLAKALVEHGEAFVCFWDSCWSGDEVPEDIGERFQEAYRGCYETEQAFAEECADEGYFGEIPSALENYIDYAAMARDLFCDGYSSVRGSEGLHVFMDC
jgi:antirestriction protein